MIKGNGHENLSKENIDCNKEKEEKKQKEKNNIQEEKDHSRVFGKDIKNSQTNSNSLPLNYPLIGVRNNLKNEVRNKITQKEKININLKFQIKEEYNKINLSQPEKDNSDSLSQIINDRNSSSQEMKEYKDLALANENVLQNRKKENEIPQETTMVKVGNFFVKKTINSSSSNNFLNESLRLNTNINKMERCDLAVKNDPQYVVDFVKDIFQDLRATEMINAAVYGFMAKQVEVNDKMRAVLIDWIIEVHLKFKLTPEALYLTVNLIDRYHSVKPITRSKLQLVAVGAMLIASKYEEIYAPEVRDFVYITDKTYSKEEILEMEYLILSTLNFDILQVSPYTFLRRFHFITGDNLKSFYLAQFILEFILMDYEMLIYCSSIKAASCLYISRKLLKMDTPWTPQLIKETHYHHDKELKNCVKDLCKIMETVPRMTLKACITKFSHVKFMEVAKINIYS